VLGTFQSEPIAVLEERFDVRLGQFPEADALLHRGVDRPVVDVGKVLDLNDFEALPLQVSPQDILAEESPEVADVGAIVHRRPAGVHRDPAFLKRLERLQTT
jgi:hypothetical protein